MAMIEPQAAEILISDNLACLPIESLPVGQCAGAVLRENIYAERDQPPFDRVAMDGVALASEAAGGGRRRFRLQATQAAGDPPTTLASHENCIEVMTGAVLPGGCDTVVPVERLQSANGYIESEAGLAIAPWKNVHRRASDRTQGALLLAAGSVLQRTGDRGGGLGRHGARARQQPAGDRRDIHRQRTGRARRSDRAASDPALQCLRGRGGTAPARLPARRR
jgi:molybdopterin biosynthesis enzyme